MSLKCANCGASVNITERERRRMAGKFMACPECGDAKKLPPWGGAASRRASWKMWAAGVVSFLFVAAIIVAVDRQGSALPGALVAGSAPPKIDGLKKPEKQTHEPVDELLADIQQGVGKDGFEVLRWWGVRPVKTSTLGICYGARMRWKIKNNHRDTSGDRVAVFNVTEDEFSGKMITGRINWSKDFNSDRVPHGSKSYAIAADEIRNAMDSEKAQ